MLSHVFGQNCTELQKSAAILSTLKDGWFWQAMFKAVFEQICSSTCWATASMPTAQQGQQWEPLA